MLEYRNDAAIIQLACAIATKYSIVIVFVRIIVDRRRLPHHGTIEKRGRSI